jgi:hypothetical protein
MILVTGWAYRRGLRHKTRQAERPRAGSVFIKPAGHTLEVVPSFDGLHASEHRVQVTIRSTS